MSSKIFWFDCETSGLDSKKCAILKLAGLIEIDGSVVQEFSFGIKPFDGAVISPEALKVNGITEEDMKGYHPHNLVYAGLLMLVTGYVDKYNPSDKFVLAGYNVPFDEQFLRSFFNLNGDKYFGSYFAWPKIDVSHCVAEAYTKGLRLINFKLETLCKQFGISIDAHDALSDIKATRNLYYKLKEGVQIP